MARFRGFIRALNPFVGIRDHNLSILDPFGTSGTHFEAFLESQAPPEQGGGPTPNVWLRSRTKGGNRQKGGLTVFKGAESIFDPLNAQFEAFGPLFDP